MLTEKEVREFLDNPATAQQVLAVLKTFAAAKNKDKSVGFPQQGIVVGDSIGAITYHLLTGNKISFDTIDIWSDAFSSNTLFGTSVTTKPYNYSVQNLIKTEYFSPNYGIKDTVYTHKVVGNVYNPTAFANLGLLNCDQCVYDIKANKIYYSDKFIDFLLTRQIEVTKFTYSSELINLAIKLLVKKQQLQNSYLNTSQLLEFLGHFYSYSLLIKKSWLKVLTTEHLTLLKQYFTVSDYDDKTFRVVCRKSDYLSSSVTNQNTDWHNIQSDVLDRLYFGLYGRGVKKAYKEKFITHFANNSAAFPLYNNRLDYFDDLPKGWQDQLYSLCVLLTEHDLFHLFNDELFRLVDILDIYKALKALIKEYGSWVIGVCENTIIRHNQYQVEQVKAEIKNQVERHHKNHFTILVERLPIRSLIVGVKVVELTTAAALLEEGGYNKHCVGGYASVISPTRRIFSLRYKSERFTVEVTYSPTYRHWVIKQCKGKRNCNLDNNTPNYDIINAALQELITELNIVYRPARKLALD